MRPSFRSSCSMRLKRPHPRILDKFLQILEGGRLTDAAGETVYFSETVMVFTSNPGTYRLGARACRAL